LKKAMRLCCLALPWRAVILCLAVPAGAQTLSLPRCPTNAPTGTEFIEHIASLDFTNREQEILSQVCAGNVPDFFRKFCAVTVTNVSAGRTNSVTFFAAPDYLAVGTDVDYFLTPLTPVTAQRIADRLGCTLPTRKMVNDIYASAQVRLAPTPLPPGPAMISVPVFAQHNTIVRTQRLAQLPSHSLGALVAGNKKDVVITAKLASVTNRVAIYGWHQTNGTPIQPLYAGHTASWVDYSHGIRLVQQEVALNGGTKSVAEVLADPGFAGLLSDEGVINEPRYPTNALPPVTSQMKGALDSARTNAVTPSSSSLVRSKQPTPDPSKEGSSAPGMVPLLGGVRRGLADFKPSARFAELTADFGFEPAVKIHLNAPVRDDFAAGKPILLIYFALPNGNTTEQTIGRKLGPGDDWHFDIQHIGAQTRFLREVLTNRTIVVAYLEAEMKSWPAWRKKHGDELIPQILGSVKKIFATNRVEVVLTGHSGGGSLTFGYLNAVERIPDDVVRIAFLDSNYAYETTNHLAKLADWLKSSPQHRLCVLAYHDSVALLDGKTFVSERGGTWGRSQAMLADLKAQFQFTHRTNGGLRTHAALDGRIQFLLKENPERKILHTVQVERNGFIHAMVSGTPDESKGYEYFGERAYTKWIQAD
jgi:hypothetical protein